MLSRIACMCLQVAAKDHALQASSEALHRAQEETAALATQKQVCVEMSTIVCC